MSLPIKTKLNFEKGSLWALNSCLKFWRAEPFLRSRPVTATDLPTSASPLHHHRLHTRPPESTARPERQVLRESYSRPVLCPAVCARQRATANRGRQRAGTKQQKASAKSSQKATWRWRRVWLCVCCIYICAHRHSPVCILPECVYVSRDSHEPQSTHASLRLRPCVACLCS